MLDAIESASIDTVSRVRRIREEPDRTVDEVKASLPHHASTQRNSLSRRVHPYSKIAFLVKSLGVERKAASRYVKSLEEIGLLESRKVDR